MPYFRADAHMIAKMEKKDCLRYDRDNLASIVTLFSVSAKAGKTFYITAVIFGDDAEMVNRLESNDFWFEVKGQLFDTTPLFEGYALAKLSIKANSIIRVPAASSSLIQCELIGRLTREPEHISKTDSYDFVKFSMAVNRKSANQAHYFDVSVFKPKLIELVNNKAHKGQSVFVSGELTFFQKGSDAVVHGSVKLEHLLMLERH